MKATSALTSLSDPRQVEVFNEVSSKLLCQCGCHMVSLGCNHADCPFCIPARLEIEEAIRAGQASGEILAQFKQEYGSQVLAAPAFTGWGRVAWLAPGVVLVIALAVAAARLSSWVRRREAQPWKS